MLKNTSDSKNKKEAHLQTRRSPVKWMRPFLINPYLVENWCGSRLGREGDGGGSWRPVKNS